MILSWRLRSNSCFVFYGFCAILSPSSLFSDFSTIAGAAGFFLVVFETRSIADFCLVLSTPCLAFLTDVVESGTVGFYCKSIALVVPWAVTSTCYFFSSLIDTRFWCGVFDFGRLFPFSAAPDGGLLLFDTPPTDICVRTPGTKTWSFLEPPDKFYLLCRSIS